MGELRKLGTSGIRVKCDCGKWIHDVTKENGKMELESYRTGKDDSETPATKKPKEKPPEKDIFDEGDDD